MGKHATIESAINEINSMKKHYNRWLLLMVRKLKTAPVLIIAILVIAGGSSITIVRAASIQDQIDSLNAQTSQKENEVSSLQLQAKSYQDAIQKLQKQISAIQSAIAASEAQQNELQKQIDADQLKINAQKKVLGEDLKAMYVGGQLTTVEMLATSKNLSDFVDAETYDSAVQGKIQDTLDQITKLQNKLESQKTQVQQLLDTQQAQQNQLAGDRAQQNQLLSYNQNQQSAYNNQIKANQSKLSALEAQQAAINAQYAQSVYVRPSGGSGGNCDIDQGNGGYPLAWCNPAKDSIYDSNGILNRECTSFAYWYFTSVEGKSLRVSGDAGDWWATANRPVDHTPQVGAIGVEPRNQPPHFSPFGHVMIVLALPNSNYQGTSVPSGDVLVMSMNEDEQGDFMYNLWPANTLYYIH